MTKSKTTYSYKKYIYNILHCTCTYSQCPNMGSWSYLSVPRSSYSDSNEKLKTTNTAINRVHIQAYITQTCFLRFGEVLVLRQATYQRTIVKLTEAHTVTILSYVLLTSIHPIENKFLCTHLVKAKWTESVCFKTTTNFNKLTNPFTRKLMEISLVFSFK